VDTVFDDMVFGPSQTQLKEQLQFLKKHTTILSEHDLTKALGGELSGKGPFSMVTFDDAYIDNYQLAMPILVEVGVPAIFFIPAFVIENRDLGWWDQIAYIIKNSKKTKINFRDEELVLKERKPNVIHYLHNIMKLAPHQQTASLVSELAKEADSPIPSRDLMDKELMTWGQLQEAHEAGITIGSHTCNHRVLATLNEEEQAEEIIESKNFLESRLDITVRSLAFPVGGLEHFNKTTLRLAEKAGYDLAFSFNTGVARIGEFNPFAIPRLGAPSDFKTFNAIFHFPNFMDYHAAKRRALQKANY
jgi:peptidoglycan/xylan/chitin deacetylase (PgdA/CDA1 family)